MHTNKIKTLPSGLLGALLLLLPVAPAVFTACDADPVKVSIAMEMDYSQIIEAINSTNQTLTEKLTLIESALSDGFADSKAAQDLLRQAVDEARAAKAEKAAKEKKAKKAPKAKKDAKSAETEKTCFIPTGEPLMTNARAHPTPIISAVGRICRRLIPSGILLFFSAGPSARSFLNNPASAPSRRKSITA